MEAEAGALETTHRGSSPNAATMVIVRGRRNGRANVE